MCSVDASLGVTSEINQVETLPVRSLAVLFQLARRRHAFWLIQFVFVVILATFYLKTVGVISGLRVVGGGGGIF